jgi:transketolase
VTSGRECGANWSDHYAGATRDIYRRTLIELARADARIFCVDSDVGGLEDTFGIELPDQYVNVGIAEANMIGICAGLAAAGLMPFANTMSSFATARACEQMKIDVAAGNLPVRIVATHAGLSAGHYGHTHHATEDLAILRSLPNMTVIVPADAVETASAIRAAVHVRGPVFVRLGRAPTPLVYHAPYDFGIGRSVQLAGGDDVTLIAVGPVPVTVGVSAAAALADRGIGARLLNMHTIKPLDVAAIVRAARETAGIVTIEDHVVTGGLGGAVCEVVCDAHPCAVHRVGVPPDFVDSVGNELELLAGCGVTADRVRARAIELLDASARSRRGGRMPMAKAEPVLPARWKGERHGSVVPRVHE